MSPDKKLSPSLYTRGMHTSSSLIQKEHGTSIQGNWAFILTGPLISCVTLGKSLNLSGPPFAHLQNEWVEPERDT